ncbi:unnamed protein product, partial [Symbiodinium pilosum]
KSLADSAEAANPEVRQLWEQHQAWQPPEPAEDPAILSYQLHSSSNSHRQNSGVTAIDSCLAVVESQEQEVAEVCDQDLSLLINVGDSMVEAASLGAISSVGMHLGALFPGQGRRLLQNVWAKEVPRMLDPRNSHRMFSFEKLLVKWHAAESNVLDGTLEAVQFTDGSVKLLMRCHVSAAQHTESGLLPVLPGSFPGSLADMSNEP